MKVRNARVSDSKAIYSLINEYAEQDKMLFRSMADIYKNLQTFTVAEVQGRVVGCCGLEVVWSDLAEIKSLAVEGSFKGKGAGRMMAGAAVEQAGRIGIEKVFALTLDPQFFEKIGFERIDKNKLPMKVWSDCARCPKQHNCNEMAVIMRVPRES